MRIPACQGITLAALCSRTASSGIASPSPCCSRTTSSHFGFASQDPSMNRFRTLPRTRLMVRFSNKPGYNLKSPVLMVAQPRDGSSRTIMADPGQWPASTSVTECVCLEMWSVTWKGTSHGIPLAPVIPCKEASKLAVSSLQ